MVAKKKKPVAKRMPSGMKHMMPNGMMMADSDMPMNKPVRKPKAKAKAKRKVKRGR